MICCPSIDSTTAAIIAAVVLWKMLGQRSKFIAFIPYMVHIFYHNDGPFQADFIFWYLLPIVMLLPGGKAEEIPEIARAAPIRSSVPQSI